jgi:hypothetical protein
VSFEGWEKTNVVQPCVGLWVALHLFCFFEALAFCSFFCPFNVSTVGRHRVTHNVHGFASGGELELRLPGRPAVKKRNFY